MVYFTRMNVYKAAGVLKISAFGTYFKPLLCLGFFLICSTISSAITPAEAVAKVSMINILLVLIIVVLAFIILYKDKREKDAQFRAQSSDLRFRKLYETGLVGLFFNNLDGRIVHANKAFLNAVGYTVQDLQAGLVNWQKMTPEEYLDITQRGINLLREHGYCPAYEKEYIRKDGKRVSVMLGSALLDKNDFAEAVTYIIDISYKKEGEKREKELNELIKKQREELYSILMNAPAMIAIFRGPELRLQFSNKVIASFVGPDPTMGLSTEELRAKLKVVADRSITREVYQTGKPYKAKAVHIHFDRAGAGVMEDIWLDMIIEPVYDDNGKIDGVAFFGFDVTEMVRANSEVKENEARFRFIADAIPHKMWTAGPDGRATYFNKGWVDYTGKTEVKEIAQRVWDSLHADDFEEALDAWSKSVETGEDLDMEERFMNLEGEYLWHLTRTHAHKDAEGNVIMWVGTSTNIHEQKMALEALKISEEHFRALSDNNALIIWQVNADGVLTYVNETWTSFTGLEMNDVLMAQTLEAIHHDDRQELRDKLGADYRAHKPLHIKFRIRHADGQFRWVLAHANPIFNPEFAGYIGSLTDIHEQEIAQKTAKFLLKKKDEFLGIASHELKTPITSMKASLQILERMPEVEFSSKKVRPFINMANKQVKKLTEIVDDLLDVTKIQSGKMQLNISEYLFQDSVQDCIHEMQQYTDGHALIINKNDPVMVFADRTRIEQVITNLLSNAIKYSPEKDRVIINIEKNGHDLRFSVTDFGIGIPQDKQSFIFDRFFRVHESSQNFSGLGLGLYISSEIINRHGGTVGMESEEGKGSTFWFTLPLGD